MKLTCALLIATLPLGAALGEDQNALTPEDLLRGLEGVWTGALGYRDYQTNALFELPMQTTYEIGPDGHAMLQTSRFTEGGERDDVYIVSLSAFDPASGLLETATFRSDRAMVVTRQTVEAPDPPVSLTTWSLVLTERGEDDGRPADIRITLTRDGDEVRSVKEVDDLTDDVTAFAYRNEYRLTRSD